MGVDKKTIIFLSVLSILVLIELSISISTYFILKNQDDNRITTNLLKLNDNIINNFVDIVTRIGLSISRYSVVFNTNGIYISQYQFNQMLLYEASIIKDSVESFIWVTKLANENKTMYENFCRQNIFANCTISEYNETSQQLIPVQTRPFYYPISLISPELSVGLELIGFDFGSNPLTKIVIDMASKYINTTGLFRINLSRTPPDNPFSYGILLTKPSFQNNSSPNISNINGFMWAVIQLNDIATESIRLTHIDRQDIDMLIFDTSIDNFVDNRTNNISILFKENKDVYRNIWFDFEVNITKNMFKNDLNIMDRNWTIYYKFSNTYIDKIRGELHITVPCIIAAICILLDIILVLLFRMFVTISKRAQSEKDKNIIATQMLGYVNHEVRNPLNVIKGLNTFILDNLKVIENQDKDPIKIEKIAFETIISDLSTIVGACDLLEHIVTDILDIRKLESGKMLLDNKIVIVDDFIKDLVKTVSQKVDEKQSLKLDLEYDKDSKVFIDPYRLKQIMLNYLTNAIKYTDEGTITIMIEDIYEITRFSITDTGRGIKDEAKERIFQPFNQINSDDASRYGGIGLGLYLCKMLAGCMGGDVGFESEYGIGSTFWVEFPKDKLSTDDIVKSEHSSITIEI